MPLQLCVFDLDFTVWDAGGTWCDHLQPPFERVGDQVVDADGYEVRLYDDIPAILDELDQLGIPAAIASRTYEPTWASRLLELHEIGERFAHRAIYPSTKTKHFEDLREQSGVPFQDMLFFDDEYRNIRDVQKLGVTAVEVSGDMTMCLFQEAQSRFS